jgi:hypothetical protein
MDLIASPPRLSLAAPPTEVRRPSRPSRAVLLTALLIDGNAPALFFSLLGMLARFMALFLFIVGFFSERQTRRHPESRPWACASWLSERAGVGTVMGTGREPAASIIMAFICGRLHSLGRYATIPLPCPLRLCHWHDVAGRVAAALELP